jgi:hypothetical protein
MLKDIRSRTVRWVARLLRVPIDVRHNFFAYGIKTNKF